MTVFFIRRLAQSFTVLIVMSMIVFVIIYAIGDPVILLMDPEASLSEREEVTHKLGLDRPLYVQYFHFVGGLIKGDLGHSYVHNISALKLIFQRMPATLELAFLAIFIAILAGIPLGIWAGVKPDSIISKGIMTGSILGFSLPTFWVGLIMILLFSIQLDWLPTFGRGQTVEIWGISVSFLTIDGIRHLIMPAVNMSLYPLSLIIRLVRAGMQETLPLDFVKFARAKGLSNHRVILVHVLKNIMIPVVTIIGVQFGIILAFAVVTESVFAWPGMGKLIIDSINLLDRPVIVAYLLITVLMFMFINLVVDLLYSVLDPRIRLGGS